QSPSAPDTLEPMEPAQLLINGLNSRESEPGLQQSAGAGVDQPLLGNRTSMTRLSPKNRSNRSRSDGTDFIQTDEPAGGSGSGGGLAGNAATSSAALSSPAASSAAGAAAARIGESSIADAPIGETSRNSDPLPHKPSDLTLLQQFDELATRAKDSAEQFMHHVWTRGWRLTPHCRLPDWLKDNDFLVQGHRPQLNTFAACFKSIFRIHTETGNIWTHMLGCIAFSGIAVYFLTRPSIEVQWQEKVVFAAFFLGAVLCMGFSFIFHTVYCHSERVGRLFNKLDYCGIALLTMGSFVPWLYYSFYCQLSPKIIYLSLISVLGTTAIVVSMFDKFAAPQYRPLRAGVFIALGLSGVIPALHYVILEGFYSAIYHASMGWLVLMALLYITGAVIYAVRFPERLFPGKFDLWFQSHQIFHVFVVAAAFVHFHGISEIANYRLTAGDCIA
uniref:Adiponectin receptor protein n=1 Tax=Macrostomum lignano TaxID=282301 RepID=A0A1I8G9P3_9PLAT